MKTNFRLLDNQEKMYFNINGEPTIFDTIKEATDFMDAYLHEGNYPDKPMSVISIHQFNDDKFICEI